jgi:hypothetical protein
LPAELLTPTAYRYAPPALVTETVHDAVAALATVCDSGVTANVTVLEPPPPPPPPPVVAGADGVTAFEGAEAGPVPTAFVAVTVNV